MNTGNISRTPIYKLFGLGYSDLYIKRDDLFPFSFGGNKARKAELFFEDIDSGEYDCVVTYGSGSSNHCRVISNMCCQRGMECYVISPQETDEMTFNKQMAQMFGAKRIIVPLDKVHNTIERKIMELREFGKKPYFIEGGGHGNIGTEAYVRCYQEIKNYEQESGIYFDYIFFASGTGTTHAGLVCGQLLNKDERKIVGISIARKNPRGRDIVIESVRTYMGDMAEEEAIQKATLFIDDYTGEGYGRNNEEIVQTIKYLISYCGVPLDPTYTGKAFNGMNKYTKKNECRDKTILFIHTGGTPLFFDALLKSVEV